MERKVGNGVMIHTMKDDTSLVPQKCPICLSASEFTPYFLGKHNYANKFEYSYFKCKECQMVFVNPMPDSKILEEIYCKEKYLEIFYQRPSPSNIYKGPIIESAQIHKDKIFLKKVLTKFIRERNFEKSTPSFFDFGCGNGSFLQYAKDLGFKVTGYEPIKENAEHLSNKLGFEILFGSLDEIESGANKKSFDVVFLADVLEHLIDPIKTLQQLKKMLKNNGILVLLSPLEDTNNLGVSTLKFLKGIKKILFDDQIANNPPYHLFLFNPNSLFNIVNLAKLQTIEKIFFSTEWPFVFDNKATLKRAVICAIIGKLSVITAETWLGKILQLQNRMIMVTR